MLSGAVSLKHRCSWGGCCPHHTFVFTQNSARARRPGLGRTEAGCVLSPTGSVWTVGQPREGPTHGPGLPGRPGHRGGWCCREGRLQGHCLVLNVLPPLHPWLVRRALIVVSWPLLAGLEQSPVAHFQPGTPVHWPAAWPRGVGSRLWAWLCTSEVAPPLSCKSWGWGVEMGAWA